MRTAAALASALAPSAVAPSVARVLPCSAALRVCLLRGSLGPCLLCGSGPFPSAALGLFPLRHGGRPDKTEFSGPLVWRRLPRWGRTQRGRAGRRRSRDSRRLFFAPGSKRAVPPSPICGPGSLTICGLLSCVGRTEAYVCSRCARRWYGLALQPTPAAPWSQRDGNTTPPRRHGLKTHTGGRVRLWTEGKWLLSIRIAPRVPCLSGSTTPSVCVARVPPRRRPCPS